MKVSVVLPIFNEEAILEKSIKDIWGKMQKLVDVFEIVAVNDGSTDGTKHILEKMQQKYKQLSIVTHPKNKGYGAVVKSGINHAKYEWIFFTDADMQFNVSELKRFIPFASEYDFVIGYRKRRAEGLKRRTISHAYNQVIRAMFGTRVRDVDCAFKLMKKSSLKKIRLTSNSFFVSCELMVRAAKKSFSIKELPVEHYKRQKGESKVTMSKVVKTIHDLIMLYNIL